ncbi:MAG: endo-1,4-beta-xylanase [Cyanobacteria bacterium J06600_6]
MIVSWGLSDAKTWLSTVDWSKRTDGNAERPLLFDRNYQPKSAYYAVMRALSEAPQR